MKKRTYRVRTRVSCFWPQIFMRSIGSRKAFWEF